MTPARRRALGFALAMGGTAALAAWLRPGPAGPAARLELDTLLPPQFDGWRIDPGSVAFVRAADRRGAQVRLYDQVLERTYLGPDGARVMLSIAYGADQSSDMQLHRPEVCYRAGGFEVGSAQAGRLALGAQGLPVTRLVARLPGRPEPITYWAVVGGQADAGRRPSLLERLARLREPRRGDGLLVRISSIEADAEAAWRRQAAFATALLRAVAPATRERLVGAPEHP